MCERIEQRYWLYANGLRCLTLFHGNVRVRASNKCATGTFRIYVVPLRIVLPLLRFTSYVIRNVECLFFSSLPIPYSVRFSLEREKEPSVEVSTMSKALNHLKIDWGFMLQAILRLLSTIFESIEFTILPWRIHHFRGHITLPLINFEREKLYMYFGRVRFTHAFIDLAVFFFRSFSNGVVIKVPLASHLSTSPHLKMKIVFFSPWLRANFHNGSKIAKVYGKQQETY